MANTQESLTAETYMTMDARDRALLYDLLSPFQMEARKHFEGAKLAGLALAIHVPCSVEWCAEKASEHKAHIDAIVEIKRRSMTVVDAFVPEFPLVHLNDASAASAHD